MGRYENHMVIRGDQTMTEVNQNVMCALLGALLERGVIPQKSHDEAKKQILGTFDWPDYFCYAEEKREENAIGNS